MNQTITKALRNSSGNIKEILTLFYTASPSIARSDVDDVLDSRVMSDPFKRRLCYSSYFYPLFGRLAVLERANFNIEMGEFLKHEVLSQQTMFYFSHLWKFWCT